MSEERAGGRQGGRSKKGHEGGGEACPRKGASISPKSTRGPNEGDAATTILSKDIRGTKCILRL